MLVQRELEVSCDRIVPGVWSANTDPVLTPISTVGKTAADVDTLMQQTRDLMLKTLEEMAQDSQAKTVSNMTSKKSK